MSVIKYNQGDRVRIVIEGTVNNFFGDNSNSNYDSLGIDTEHGEVYLEVEKKLGPFVEVIEPLKPTIREQFDALNLGDQFSVSGSGAGYRIKTSATQYYNPTIDTTYDASDERGDIGCHADKRDRTLHVLPARQSTPGTALDKFQALPVGAVFELGGAGVLHTDGFKRVKVSPSKYAMGGEVYEAAKMIGVGYILLAH